LAGFTSSENKNNRVLILKSSNPVHAVWSALHAERNVADVFGHIAAEAVDAIGAEAVDGVAARFANIANRFVAVGVIGDGIKVVGDEWVECAGRIPMVSTVLFDGDDDTE